MQQLKKYLIIILATSLVACAPPKSSEEMYSKIAEPETINNPVNKKTLKVKSSTISFKLSGAMAVNKNGKGWNASLNWTQKDLTQYNIRLSGPLGGKTIIINKQNSLITYRDGVKTLKSSSGEDLLRKQAKINIPVDNLYYWVRGVPAPGKILFAKYNTNNQLLVLKQAGFIINYEQYMSDNNGNVLPRKIRLQGNNLTIKLIIHSWG